MDLAPGRAIYAGRGWSGEEPLCPRCCEEPIWLNTVQNLDVPIRWGDWVELSDRIAGPNVFASTPANGCYYVSGPVADDEPGPTWEHPVLARVIGVDSDLWDFPTQYFVQEWFVRHPETEREITVPRPSCVCPAYHQANRTHTVVLALAAPNSSSPPRESRHPRIDDAPR